MKTIFKKIDHKQLFFIIPLFLLLVGVCFFFLKLVKNSHVRVAQANPGTCYWVGTTDPANWNDPANWSSSSGGAGSTCEGGANVPGPTTNVVFDSANLNSCTVDIDVSVASITNSGDYTGTLDANGHNITITGDFTWKAGGVNMGTGIWTVSGNWNNTGVSSWTYSTSTLVLNGTDKTFTTSHGGQVAGKYHNITIDGTITSIAPGGSGFYFYGTLTVNNGKTLTLGDNGCYGYGGGSSVVINGTINGSGLLSLGGSLNTGGTLDAPVEARSTPPARVYGNNLTFWYTSSKTWTLESGTYDIRGNLGFAVRDGVYTLDASVNNPTMIIGGNISGGSYGGYTGYPLVKAGSGTWTVGGDIDFAGGNTDWQLEAGNSTFILNGTSAQTITSAGNSFNNLTIKNTSAEGVILADNLSVNGNLNLAADGSSNVLLDAATNNVDVNVAGNLDFVGTGDGTESISMGSGTWSIDGNVDFTDGSITAGTSTLDLSGNSDQSLTSANQTLYNLTISNPSSSSTYIVGDTTVDTFTAITPSSRIVFTAGATYNFTNININGQATDTRITLVSSSPGTQWLLNVSGSQTVAYVDVSDSDASGGNQINATDNCLNSGNNTNWLFATDHIIVSPASITMYPSDTTQFTAVAYDSSNYPIPGAVFNWSVVAGGGTITDTGLFTAGSIPGTFTNTIQAENSGVTGTATVIIQSPPSSPEETPPDTDNNADNTNETPQGEEQNLGNYKPSGLYLLQPKISAPTKAEVNTKIKFSAKESTSSAGIISFGWDFDDGTTATGKEVYHTYSEINRYQPTLTIKDANGNYASVKHIIDIIPQPPELTKMDTDGMNVVLEGKAHPNTEVVITIHSDYYETKTRSSDKGEFKLNFDFADTGLDYGDHKIIVYAQKKISDDLILKSNTKEYDAYFNLSDSGELTAKIKQLERKQKIYLVIIALLLMTAVILIIYYLKTRKRHSLFPNEKK